MNNSPRRMARNGTLDGDSSGDFLDDIARVNSDDSRSDADNRINALLGGIAKFALCIVFFPVVGVAFLFYLLWRRVRLRPSVLAGIGAVSMVAGIVVMVAMRLPERFGAMFGNRPSGIGGIGAWLGAYTGTFVGIIVAVGLIVGPLIASVFIWLQMRMLKHDPWLTTTEGEDYYHFMYRLTPREILRRNRTIGEIKNGDYVPYGDERLTPLGMEDVPMNPPSNPSRVKRWQVVSRSMSEATMHTLITGSTGAGKSKTMLSIILRDIIAGRTVVIIDNKNSPDFACSIAHMAKAHGRNFMHFSVSDPYPVLENEDGPCAYDPLSTGSVAKKTDMVLGMREWDTNAAVYREQSQSYLSIVFATLDMARRLGILDRIPTLDTSKGELNTFVQALDRNIFNRIVIEMNKYPQAAGIRQQASDLNAKLSKTGRGTQESQAMQHAQTEYQSVFSGLMATYGKNLVSDGTMRTINLMEMTSEPNNVILFSLDASKQGDRGSELGAMICQDLTNMSESRPARGINNPISIYIDEFQSLPPTCVSSMLQKARASKVGLTLAFQSLDQVVAATDGKDAYVKGLLDTCSNFIFHSGSNRDTGELAAKIIGKKKTVNWIVPRMSRKPWLSWLWTKEKNQVATKSTEEEYILDPSSFQQLSIPSAENGYKSEAIVIKKVSSDPIDKGHVGASAHKVQIIPPKEVLEEFYDPIEFRQIMEERGEEIEYDDGTANDIEEPSPEPEPEPLTMSKPRPHRHTPSTPAPTADTVHTVHTVDTVHTAHTVNNARTVDTVRTAHTVDNARSARNRAHADKVNRRTPGPLRDDEVSLPMPVPDDDHVRLNSEQSRGGASAANRQHRRIRTRQPGDGDRAVGGTRGTGPARSDSHAGQSHGNHQRRSSNGSTVAGSGTGNTPKPRRRAMNDDASRNRAQRNHGVTDSGQPAQRAPRRSTTRTNDQTARRTESARASRTETQRTGAQQPNRRTRPSQTPPMQNEPLVYTKPRPHRKHR